MGKQRVTTSMAPEVIIEQVFGNLQVRGWDRPEVIVTADPQGLTLEEQDDTVRLSCQGECSVRLPHDATIQVENAHGNARFKLLNDQLDIVEVHGSLSLRDVSATQIERVQGELSVRGVSGHLRVGYTQGNATVRKIQGNCYLEQVQGNVDLREVEGEVQARAGGNARLRLGVMAGSDYQIQADGNVHCHIPEDASLSLNLSSVAGPIRVRLPDGVENYHESCELTLDEGQASLAVSTGGSIHLYTQKAAWEEGDESMFDFAVLPEDFGQQIAQQVETKIRTQMEEMTRQLNEQMTRLSEKVSQAGLPPEEAERFMEQALRTSERETARTQQKVRRAQQKLERKLEATQRRAQASDRRTRAHKQRSRGDWSPPPPTPQEPQVSEEERLMILRMLEQKKISLEEADQLLAALEDQG